MRRRPFPPVLTEAKLREYEGEYVSDELLGARNALVGFELSTGRMKGISFVNK